MRWHVGAIVSLDATVTTYINPSGPLPAAIHLDSNLGPEAISQRDTSRHAFLSTAYAIRIP